MKPTDRSYEERLGTDRMLPLVFRMTMPAVAAQLVNLLYNIVDRIYIGHIPEVGTDALAGIGITSSIIVLLSAFASIVSGGSAPLAAIALGEGDRERAGKLLGNGLFMLAVFTLGTTLPVYLFMDPILYAIGASSHTIGYASEYLSLYMIGTLASNLAIGMTGFIYTQGRPKIAMTAVVIGAAANIALDPLFIFSFGMGIRGAAVATVISQTLSAVWVLHFLLSEKATLKIERKYLRPELPIILAAISLGISPFIMASTESIVGFVLNGTLKHFGDIYVSALSVMQSAMLLVSVPLSGFSQGFVPIVSYNYGHGNISRVKSCFRIVVTTMFTANLVIVAFMILFPRLIGSAFTEDTVLLDVIQKMMPVFLAGMTIFGVQRACQNMFIALNSPKISVFIALLRKIILLVPLAILLSRVIGVEGVFIAEAVSDATAAICCTLIFAFFFPKILKKVRPSAEEGKATE